jgi:hypothetical protein
MKLVEMNVALYRGEKFITSGTPPQIAKELSVKVSTILFYLSPAYARRSSKSNRRIIELPEWINDHKKTCPQSAVTGDAESITLWDMIKIVAQIVPIALLICVVWAAW